MLMTRHPSRDLLAALTVVALFAGACWTEPTPEPSDNPRLPLAVESEPAPVPAADPEPFVSTVPPLTYDLTVEPKNIPQLRRSIDRAYSAYESQLRDLMRERGEELHGIAAAHELIGQQADDAYEAFQLEQSRLQDRLQRPHGRPMMTDAVYVVTHGKRGGDGTPGHCGGDMGDYTRPVVFLRPGVSWVLPLSHTAGRFHSTRRATPMSSGRGYAYRRTTSCGLKGCP